MEMVWEAWADTLKMVPLLLVIYGVIGFLEYRYENRFSVIVARLGVWGPVAGAMLGCLPQCGFSVVVSALYVKRLVSVGTLLAVYLATSDEAVPILFSMPWEVRAAISLIAIKVVIAIVAGVGIDALMRSSLNKGKHSDPSKIEQALEHHPGCCAHEVTKERSALKALVFHPLIHTVKIFIFLFVLTVFLNFIIDKIGTRHMNALFLNGTIFQPLLASLIGLIPNCFASVFLVQLFVQKVLTFGSLAAGLCAASGLGLLVLIKENKDFKNTLFIIALLLGISIFSGTIIQFSGK